MASPNRRLSQLATANLVRLLEAIAALDLVTAAAGLIALVLALAEVHSAVPAVLAVLVTAVTGVFGWRQRDPRRITGVGFAQLPRLLAVLVGAVLAARWGQSTGDWTSVWVASLLLGMAVITETLLLAVGRAAQPYAANLPGVAVRNYPLIRLRLVFVVNVVAAALFIAMAAVPGLVGWVWVAALPAAAVTALAAADGMSRLLARRRAEGRLAGVLDDLGATFVLYWDAPPGSIHQIAMWLPYLKRLGKPFLVVLRVPATFGEVEAATDVPILVRRYVSELEVLMNDTLKTAFFVNTAPTNANMVHYLGINQIQLNHGDSDKAPSYRRVFRMYDKNFVAGQAAIDRFANNGVFVPREAFEIVGRPQVEAVQVSRTPIRELAVKRVLYAPTWFGYLDDSRYCSLEIGPAVVDALLARGCKVVFRPHPWTARTPALARAVEQIDDRLAADRRNGRNHVFGPAATRGSVLETFNAADAMIADVSSVVPDFLYSEKPFAITSMVTDDDDEFVADFPLARAGYVLARDLSNLDQVLDGLLENDPLAERRRSLKTYYLGDFPPESYAEGFLSAARRYV